MRHFIILFLVAIAITVSACKWSSQSASSFRLAFPESISLGQLWLIEDVNCFTCGTGAKNLGPAVGRHDVRLPAAHWFIRLQMPIEAAHLMPYLENPSLNNIGDLQLQDSDVTDEDLRHIAKINLRSINLSGTKITGAGLKYLSPHAHWTTVDLTGCDALDPALLIHFRGWTQSTIRLTSDNRSGRANSGSDQELLEQAKQIICDGQDENVCGTQIR